jgi:hypothetical protein
MKLIRPVTLTDATLISSTVAEPSGSDPSVWSSGTTYALDALAYRASTHRIYQSLQAGNTANTPESSPTWWAEVSGTNKWAMFDTGVSSATSGTSPLTVVIKPGFVDSLVLIGCVGDTVTVTIRDGLAGAIVFGPAAYTLTATVSDWYGYFVSPTRYIPMVLLSDLPIYLDAHITVTIAGSGTVSCAMCIPGQSFIIGDSQYGVGIGIRDYSRKLTNETTGIVTLEQRKFAKTMTAQVRLDSAQYAEVQEALESLRATPCVWIADKTGDISPLTVYGFYKDFRLVVDYPTSGVYSLEIEGMV